MDSLHPPCTPLKKKYDACFNHWFDEYLQLAAPTTSTSTSSSSNGQQQKLDTDSIASERSKDDRQTKIKSKAAEYEQRCGETWKAYRNCLEVRRHARLGVPLSSLPSKS